MENQIIDGRVIEINNSVKLNKFNSSKHEIWLKSRVKLKDN